MSDLNPNELPAEDAVIETLSAESADEKPAESIPADDAGLPLRVPRRGYRNPTARLMNVVFIVFLILMAAFLLFQFFFSIYSYLGQGAPTGTAVLYTLVGMTMPLFMCLVPFLFKFFAEVVELLDRNKA